MGSLFHIILSLGLIASINAISFTLTVSDDLKNIKFAYKLIDPDGNGISIEEFKLMFKDTIPDQDIDEIYKKLDTDGNNSISLSEFAEIIAKKVKDDQTGFLKYLMVGDANNDGELSTLEAAVTIFNVYSIRNGEDDSSLAVFVKVFESVDEERDGSLTLTELTEYLKLFKKEDQSVTLMKNCDLTGDKQLGFVEFVRCQVKSTDKSTTLYDAEVELDPDNEERIKADKLFSFIQPKHDQKFVVDEKDVNIFRTFFYIGDKDGSLNVGIEELNTLLLEIGFNQNVDVVKEKMVLDDVNGDGTLDFLEFFAVFIRKPGMNKPRAGVLLLFSGADPNGDGCISAKELERQLELHFHVLEVSDNKAELVYQALVPNQNGLVSISRMRDLATNSRSADISMFLKQIIKGRKKIDFPTFLQAVKTNGKLISILVANQ